MKGQKPTTLRRRLHALMFKAPLMITCEEFEDFILAYLDGGLTKRQRFVFETHLKVCAECRAYLAEYQRTIQMAAAQRDVAPSDIPEDLITAVLDARSAK